MCKTKKSERINDETVKEICNYLANTNLSRKEIADLTGTTVDVVHQIQSKRTHTDITTQYDFDTTLRRGRKLSDDDIDKIVDLLRSGVSTRKVAERFGVTKTVIQRIKQGNNYKNINDSFISPNEDIFNDADTIKYMSKGRNTNIAVTKDGRLFSVNTHKEIKPNKNTGMVIITCDDGTKFTKSADRIFGEAFFDLQQSESIEHIDDDKDNYSIDNLRVISFRDKLRKSHIK